MPEELELDNLEQDTEQIAQDSEQKDVDLNNYIPKATALAWKHEKKELERKLRDYEAKETEAQEQTRITKIRQLALEKGIGDDEADVYTELAKELFKSIPKNDRITEEIENEIDDLKDLYPDIKQFKEKLASTVKLYRKANPDFSVEDAYKLVAPKRSAREIKTELEQKAAMRTADEEPILTSGVKKAKSKLSDDESRTLKLMQQAHPDRGWTEEKFIKLMRR